MDLEKNAIGILQTLCGNSGCVISDSGGKPKPEKQSGCRDIHEAKERIERQNRRK